MANLLDTLDKAKEVVNGIKDISTINNETVMNVSNGDTSMDSADENIVAVPMVTKSVTNMLLWIMVGFTIALSIAGGICMIVFDKDISTVITQLMGYTVPVSLGCLAKKGVENVANTKYLDK